jgi:hypothetical protein
VALHPYLLYYIDGNVKRETDYVISQPQRHWRKVREELDWAFRDFAGGKRRPLFVNEYGLIPPFNERDSRNYMNTHVDALFQADSLGQMIQNNVDMAAQWALMNGRSDNYGNEFGLMKADGRSTRQPKYFVIPLWRRFGSAMLPVKSSAAPQTEVSVYAGMPKRGVITIMAINKTGAPAPASITLANARQITGGSADELTASAVDSTASAWNGLFSPADDLSDAPAAQLPAAEGQTLSYVLKPFAITLLTLTYR